VTDCEQKVSVILSMGGAADFKVGYKTGFASGAGGRKLYPTFPNVGYKQANISQGS